MRSPVKVVLADDHTLFREGLAKILSSSKDVKVVGYPVPSQCRPTVSGLSKHALSPNCRQGFFSQT